MQVNDPFKKIDLSKTEEKSEDIAQVKKDVTVEQEKPVTPRRGRRRAQA